MDRSYAKPESPIGIGFLTDFWKKNYLSEYIKEGGSKIKFVTGRPGAGKTFMTRVVMDDARDMGYLTVSFSAKSVWLHDFKEIYLEILKQCDIESLLTDCAKIIAGKMGYDLETIDAGTTLIDHLAERGEADPLMKAGIREELRSMFHKNPLLDYNFAVCCALLTGDILGHPALEPQNRQLLIDYLNGEKVKLAQLRALGLSPDRITRFNARHMLRSLSELIRQSGRAGLLVVIDDMEVLINRSSLEEIHYTKTRREDTYESIRQLIDDIDSMRNIMFVLAFDRELMDNDNYGMKSYQALWMRIQNEIVGSRFNRFADIVDMDRLGSQIYTPDILVEMSRAFITRLNGGKSDGALTLASAQELYEHAGYGSIGLPLLVQRTTLSGGEADV